MSDVIWKRALKTALAVAFFIVIAFISSAIYEMVKLMFGGWLASGFALCVLTAVVWFMSKEPTHD